MFPSALISDMKYSIKIKTEEMFDKKLNNSLIITCHKVKITLITENIELIFC